MKKASAAAKTRSRSRENATVLPAPWLLLIHQIPPKPDYFRVKIGRRLQRIGAVAIKSSVYALPNRDDTYEDFEWVLREIVEGGGEASMCAASFVEGLTDDAVRALFRGARETDYQQLAQAAQSVLDELAQAGQIGAARRASMGADLARLRRRAEEIVEIDFFGAAGRQAAEATLASIDEALRRDATRGNRKQREPTAPKQCITPGRTWVTRRDVHVDRIASAWLIRRFVDPAARFKFVVARGYRPARRELRFDMYDAEYTHEGGRCTFETLLARFGLDDPALRRIAEIVHDLDFKTETFGREETAGVAQLIAGIVLLHADDDARLARGSAVLDDLYAAFTRMHGDVPAA